MIGMKQVKSGGLIGMGYIDTEVCGVNLRVFRDGKVVNLSTGEEMTTYNFNGYKGHFVNGKDGEGNKLKVGVYKHRMLAELYVPKENDELDTVVFKNNDKSDIRIENLVWKNWKEYIREVRKTAFKTKNMELCKECKKVHVQEYKDSGLCYKCMEKQNKRLKREEKLQDMENDIKRYLPGLDYATKKQQEVLLARKEGKTFREIGEDFGISKQAAEQRFFGGKQRIEKMCRKFGVELVDLDILDRKVEQ